MTSKLSSKSANGTFSGVKTPHLDGFGYWDAIHAIKYRL